MSAQPLKKARAQADFSGQDSEFEVIGAGLIADDLAGATEKFNVLLASVEPVAANIAAGSKVLSVSSMFSAISTAETASGFTADNEGFANTSGAGAAQFASWATNSDQLASAPLMSAYTTPAKEPETQTGGGASGGLSLGPAAGLVGPIGLGGFTNGNISVDGETDEYSISLLAGHTYSFNLFGNSSGNRNSLGDTVLTIFSDAALTTQVFTNDDFNFDGGDYDSYGTFTPTVDGTYYVQARGYSNNTGEYSLIVEDRTVSRPRDAIDWGSNFYDQHISVYFAPVGEILEDGVASLGWTQAQIDDTMAALQAMVGNINLTASRELVQANANMFLYTYSASDGSSGHFTPAGEQPNAGIGAWNLINGSYLLPGAYTNGWQAGNGAFHTLIHEFGHALGLAHAQDGGGHSTVMSGVGSSTGDYGDFDLNQGAFTIMGYNYLGDVNGSTAGGTSPNGLYGHALGPSAIDLGILQSRYGANMSVATGNDIYWIVDQNAAGTGFRTIWDAGGSLDYIAYGGTRDVTIDLRAATLLYEEGGGGWISHADGIFGGYTIANGVVIEVGQGSSGNDTIIGNAANNTLFGGGGNDTLTAGAGNDTLNGDAGNDTLNGGADDDTLNGGSNNDVLNGDDGNDTLNSGTGNDTLNGGAGNDTLRHDGNGASALNGNEGNDLLAIVGGFAAGSTLNGGADIDTFDISFFTIDGSSVNLNTGIWNDGFINVLTLAEIENVTGQNGIDTITGNALDNVLFGLGGNDTIDGGDGNDYIRGGNGADNIIGNNGNDLIYGEAGADTINGGTGDHDNIIGGADGDSLDGGAGTNDLLNYEGSGSGVTINLGALSASGGDATGDTFSNFESIAGSSHDDSLTGDSGANSIYAHGGNDTLDGGGGIDRLFGYAGNDTLYQNGHDTDVAGETYDGGADSDTLQLTGTGAPIVNNLSNDFLTSIERLLLDDSGSGGSRTVILEAGQFGAGISSSAQFQFDIYGDNTELVQIAMGSATSLNLSGLVFAGETSTAQFQITGDGDAETIVGTSLRDVINGGGGADNISGGAGEDTITASNTDFGVYDGGADNDTMMSSEFLSTMIGGTGVDTIDHRALNLAYTFNMMTGLTNFGGESYTEFENVIMGNGTNNVIGTDGDNVMTGGTGDDTLDARDGNDIIYGGAGNDTLDGGLGNDTLYGGNGNDTLYGGVGLFSVNMIYGEAGDDTIIATSFTSGSYYDGGADNDTIFSTSGDEVMVGGTGVDTINHSNISSNYTFDMTTGLTNISGESFTEFENVVMGNGMNNVTGTTGDNRMTGGTGNDTFTGLAGNDTLIGGLGNDLLDGGADTDTASYAGASAGVVVTLRNTTTFQDTQGAGSDRLVGIENLIGSDFNDTFTSDETGANELRGGLGNDRYIIYQLSDVAIELAGEGTADRVDARANITLLATSEIETMFASLTTGMTLGGSDTANTMNGNTGADTLNGNGGNDTLNGLDGNDTLNGGNGNDVLEGGVGNDALNGGADIDTASYAAATSAVTVSLLLATAQNTLGAGTDTLGLIENLTGSAFNDTLTGSNGDNTINGGAGDDTINGRAGIDTLAGGAGNDRLFVDNALDVVIEIAGQGTADGVFATVDYTLAAGQSIELLAANAGATGLTLTGNELANTVQGNAGVDILFGGDGNDIIDGRGNADVMNGGTGNDRYYVDNAGDVLHEASLEGTLDIVFASVNYTLGAGEYLERLYANAGATGLTLTGNELINALFGNSGNDTLIGGAGADTLTGNAGNDRLVGGTGIDTLFGNAGADVFVLQNFAADRDTIRDFATEDQIEVSASLFGGGLVAGSLAANRFVSNGTGLAGDSDDRFIYNTSNGALYFDIDGDGATARVQIATLTGMPALTAGDFTIAT